MIITMVRPDYKIMAGVDDDCARQLPIPIDCVMGASYGDP
jgi:hypothetical protein